MDAVVNLTGHGGWPLNVLLTPDLKPFFGGTYFQKEKLITLLGKVQEVWQSQPQEILQSAESITAALQAEIAEDPSGDLDQKTLELFFMQMKNSFDATWGGFTGAPKFPQSLSIQALLRYFVKTGEDEALSMAAHTLEQMARGGIYDHLGGGFSRYSTDERWAVPHFEKMLYDNALLSLAYLETYQITKATMFRSVAVETLDYVLEKLTDNAGGFYCAEDAGEVGREGEFYIWAWSELETILSQEELELFSKAYGASAAGNFEDGFIVLTLAPQYDWDIKEDRTMISAHRKLLATRNERRRPHLDDKVLTSWNALTISAMSKAFQVTGDQKYLSAAQKCAGFIKTELSDASGKLLHRYRDGDAAFAANLDDYSYLIQALIDLYESDADSSWIDWATQLQDIADTEFWDDTAGNYFFTSASDTSLIVRKRDYSDGATPSGNGISALNLQRLYYLTMNKEYEIKSTRIMDSVAHLIKRYPSALSSTLLALDYSLSKVKQIAIVGDKEKRASLTEYVHSQFIPNKVLAFKDDNDSRTPATFLEKKSVDSGSAVAYLCEKNTCKEPITRVEDLMKELAVTMGIPSKQACNSSLN